MRPLRFLLTLTTCIVAFLLLVVVAPWHSDDGLEEERGGLGAYFNWRTPSSLFPPSAIISITDDNSTNFVARPAAFGPLLPAKSLSGQLWIGSGFGNDHLGRGGSGAGAAGELGCSDVPGWDDGSWIVAKKPVSESKSKSETSSPEGKGPLAGNSKRDYPVEDEDEEKPEKEYPTEDDGTDDHLHHPLPASDGIHVNGNSAGSTKKPTHADIQSLQESAEIAGKVVLLSRGGCGFLEKVKWVQRRGGIALIVGDDIRGGPLVTMYARGDTSNVTIPSLFTSYTTAQLLSSLMPAGGKSAAESKKIVIPALGQKSSSRKPSSEDKPNFTTTAAGSKATSATQEKQGGAAKPGSGAQHKAEEVQRQRTGWLASLFGSHSHSADSRRPPSSGKPGWVLQEDFEDDLHDQKAIKQDSITPSSSESAGTKKVGSDDGFVIGVQDWRDPDMVAEQKEQHLQDDASRSSAIAEPKSTSVEAPLKGGSITPGSGEYGESHHEAVDIGSPKKTEPKKDAPMLHAEEQQESGGWFGRLFGAGHHHPEQSHKPLVGLPAHHEQNSQQPTKPDSHRKPHLAEGTPHHEGLWVTLSPASMSSSPFFDTLLVLVVSPLVTLTVVYALLLLRSRIRRRRWRAPKSVVERLPVRTYQTMPSSTASTTSISSQASATTPLLPASRPISTRSRPRARTASDLPQSSGSHSDSMASPSLEQIEEKRAAGLAEWRRRYGGKQRECVVCLEEYIDGVSRVMSLPCGHEFHAECITPWLTTRRRTCPICKGDVVRSLARNGASSSAASTPSHYAHEPYRDDTEDEVDVQEQAVTLVNDDPASQQPVSREDEAFEDLERGLPDRNR
ncbi:hypothetical protein CB0940_05472 [Cercospora beticola]|uniref:RING-type E3 ubiquitin transferase n=1 Tax=Cercospora beticola TaxID=122368 RepID=A0A2G5HYT9_CERBT|nr:hypothetical protein CB0940_05472 [Cercospora beticola]PIA97453.1 hypothetical protein CB0940_05472 [Cercospora beticola]WPA98023.1 hypothetical protein RHO25_002634 [Cercospora beticola]